MPDGYGVLTDELGAHAGRLDALNDRLEQAFDAANQVHLGSAAYGVICQFFVPIVQAVSQPAVDSIRETATTVEATANGVRETAGSYSNTERANTQPFSGGAR
ncbi:type VII secretion target [Actinokineospora cianjurensis]|uniref:Excreted virulence factor EspC (Type VII ESX diderm) n=1 Tax=Actinokineospora cianjurensis TaxID=585224 RepID=A0A421B7F7_9PSEU|nr:type VII secretion target [Actinokineospora cianjurensis]RLK60304.1 excreted virulence factor EspC (type VII ESX diderm) [Actinokineospora cianjurensis]